MSNIGAGFKPRASALVLGPNSVACKCQICNCGSHKCPPDRHIHQLTPYEADQLQSESRRAFQAPAPSKRGEMRPKQESCIFGSGQPFEGQSTVQTDFRAPGPGATRAPKPRQGEIGLINGGNQEQNFTSENRANFGAKGIAVRESFAPSGAKHTTGMPFDGTSTTATDYRYHSGAKPSTPFKETNNRGNDKDDRDFQTEAALKFVQHSDQRRQNFAPAPRSRENNAPFDGMTTTKSDYPGYGSNAGASRVHPPAQSHSTGIETRDFQSQNASQYGSKGYSVREPFRPKSDQVPFGASFEGQSTSKTDFTGAQGSRNDRVSMKPRQGLTDTIGVAIGAPEDRQWVSENRGQFDTKGQPQTRQSFAPSGAKHTTNMPFEGSSTTATDFKYHSGAKPSTPFKETNNRGNDREDRDFQSEASLKFVSHGPGSQRESFHPQDRTRNSTSLPFQGESTSKADFKPWTRPGCPANDLPDGGSRGPDGHTMYKHDATGRWTPQQR